MSGNYRSKMLEFYPPAFGKWSTCLGRIKRHQNLMLQELPVSAICQIKWKLAVLKCELSRTRLVGLREKCLSETNIFGRNLFWAHNKYLVIYWCTTTFIRTTLGLSPCVECELYNACLSLSWIGTVLVEKKNNWQSDKRGRLAVSVLSKKFGHSWHPRKPNQE